MLFVFPVWREAGAVRSMTRTYSSIGRIGSCVPLHVISVAFAPHCWNATSLAVPEYVMDFTSPIAFWALAITVFASCSLAHPQRDAMQIAITLSLLNTDFAPSKSKNLGVHQKIIVICRLRQLKN